MSDSRSIIFANTSDAIIELDEHAVITAANHAAERMLREKSATMVGAGFWKFFPEALTPIAETALASTLSGKRTVQFDLFFPPQYIWASVLAVPAEKGAVLFMRDITDRVRMIQKEAVQEGVRQIIEVAPVAISIARGPEHRTEMMNAKSRDLIGGRDLIGMTARKAFPELEGQGILETLDEVYRTGVPFEGKEVFVQYRPTEDAEMRDAYFDISYQPLRDTAGAVSGILTVSVDVTAQVLARKRLEELLPDPNK